MQGIENEVQKGEESLRKGIWTSIFSSSSSFILKREPRRKKCRIRRMDDDAALHIYSQCVFSIAKFKVTIIIFIQSPTNRSIEKLLLYTFTTSLLAHTMYKHFLSPLWAKLLLIYSRTRGRAIVCRIRKKKTNRFKKLRSNELKRMRKEEEKANR